MAVSRLALLARRRSHRGQGSQVCSAAKLQMEFRPPIHTDAEDEIQCVTLTPLLVRFRNWAKGRKIANQRAGGRLPPGCHLSKNEHSPARKHISRPISVFIH